MKQLDQPEELRAYYRDRTVVAEYINRRTAQPLNGYLHCAQVRFLNRVVQEIRPEQMLEIAPGPARLTAEVVPTGRAIAVDASLTMLDQARRRLIERQLPWLLVQGDAFGLPFRDRTFDFVYSLKLIRHFQLADRNRLYAEIRRVLRPGGAFVMDAQNRSVSLPHREKHGSHRYKIYDVLYDHPDEICAELAEAGFEVERTEGILKHFVWQKRFNRLRLYGLATLARQLIRAAERVPGDRPSTWMVFSKLI